MECHLDIAERLNKPVVVEEFGFPRDSVRFDRGTPTRLRDAYYTDLLDRVIGSKAEGGLLAGCNFWGWPARRVRPTTTGSAATISAATRPTSRRASTASTTTTRPPN